VPDVSGYGGEYGTVTSLSVVVPCFNEADNIIPGYREIVDELAGDLDLELIYVDDGSTDRTLDTIKELAARDPRVHFLSFTRNYGFEAAFSAGYRYARRPWILHLDADQQFPAAEARRLIAAADGGLDAVFGVRVQRRDPASRRLATGLFQIIARGLLRIELPPGATAFRLVRSDLAREVVGLRLGTPYFLATVPRLTNRYGVVPVAHRPRVRGRSKVRVGALARHAVELFIGHSSRPSTATSVLALTVALTALGLALGVGLGGLGVRAALAAVLVVLAVVLLGTAFLARMLLAVSAGQPRPRLYYVREANLPVDAADLLCGPIVGDAAGSSVSAA